ncbi:IclR family transcriptional regulator [Halocatena pleomorpha]|uniref:MarR family transcriptional regulator n=1 Tax=Halocatena pleomorpha TaxID=1785090 RepID=A0A3P3RGV8_9EURY|nr:hypothetical protein [Halocatena pleomorpha]RRJ32178.1 hypothetical protein EIK79_05270 [Halocatena pleomorpha]
MSANSKRSDWDSVESLDWMLSVDDRLLTYFGKHGPGLCPEAAGMLGLHVSFAEKRCETLCDHGFLRKCNTRYHLTDIGQQYLDTDE